MDLNSLSYDEKSAVLAAIDNAVLWGALRKIWQAERDVWLRQGKSEALAHSPSVTALIQCAARAAEAENFEDVVRRAVGL